MIMRIAGAALALAVALPRLIPAASAADTTPPFIVKAQMVDSDGDDRADRVVLTYSERVSTPGHARPGPFGVSAYYITSVQSATRSLRVTLVLAEHKNPDAGAAPAVDYAAVECGGAPVVDIAGNEARTQTFRDTLPHGGGTRAGSPAPVSPPRIVSAQMKDADGDRQADQLVLTYDRAVNYPGEPAGSKLFSVDGYRITRVNRATASKTLVLRLAEKSKPDTAAEPDASYCAPPVSAAGPQVRGAGPNGRPADSQIFNETVSIDDGRPDVPPVVRVRTKARLAVSVAGALECSGAFIKVDGVRAAGEIIQNGLRSCVAEFTGVPRGADVEISVLGAAPPTPAVGGCEVFDVSDFEDSVDGDILTTDEITLTAAGFGECVL